MSLPSCETRYAPVNLTPQWRSSRRGIGFLPDNAAWEGVFVAIAHRHNLCPVPTEVGMDNFNGSSRLAENLAHGIPATLGSHLPTA